MKGFIESEKNLALNLEEFQGTYYFIGMILEEKILCYGRTGTPVYFNNEETAISFVNKMNDKRGAKIYFAREMTYGKVVKP